MYDDDQLIGMYSGMALMAAVANQKGRHGDSPAEIAKRAMDIGEAMLKEYRQRYPRATEGQKG